ncbi:MFS transporter [Roseicyclus sp. F158]|uniref:MFS transporter n=1 Tax=Tropicimonas omnivorans TaxID=3075590 RepID=A0ABU3DJ65_9RHOB|nr:MFS transporter [Roseicyclus sp. F158]MDT0683770.1 MFS transporter [Roseicyclus sp. F158]
MTMRTDIQPAGGHTRWGLVLALFLTGLLAAGQFAKVALTIDAAHEVWPGAGRGVAIAISVVGIVGILFGVMAGGLVARIGARRALVGAMAFGGAVSLLQAMLPPFALFLSSRALEGASHLVIVVAAPTLMAAAASEGMRPVVMGIWGTFFGVGFALTATIVPGLIGAGGLPLLFALHGAGLLAMAAILWPLLPRSGRGAPVSLIDYVAQHRLTYSDPRRRAPAFGFVCYTASYISLVTFLAPRIGDAATAVLPLVSLVGTLSAGVMCRRVSPARVATIGYGASAAALVVLLAVPEEARFAVAVVQFICLGLVPGASFADIAALNAAGPDRARATGAIAQFGNIGTTLGPPLFSLFAASIGGICGLAAALSILGMVAVRAAHRGIGPLPAAAPAAEARHAQD